MNGSLADRLHRNLINGILDRAAERIRHQSPLLGYDPNLIMQTVTSWWRDGSDIPPELCPDTYWREFHGHSDELGCVAHVALCFITLGCSEADMERLISLQKGIQGIHGTNYRMETLHARAVLHQNTSIPAWTNHL
jgi:hypothetical protein